MQIFLFLGESGDLPWGNIKLTLNYNLKPHHPPTQPWTQENCSENKHCSLNYNALCIMMICCITKKIYRSVENKKISLFWRYYHIRPVTDSREVVSTRNASATPHVCPATCRKYRNPLFSCYFFKRIDVVLFRTKVLNKKKSRKLHCVRIISFECKKLKPFQTSHCGRT